jgi:hypothetical protein
MQVKFFFNAMTAGAAAGLTASATLLYTMVTHSFVSSLSGKPSPLFELESNGYLTAATEQYASTLIHNPVAGLALGAAVGAVTTLAACSIFTAGKNCYNSAINSREKQETTQMHLGK